MKKCSIEGCGKKSEARSFCKNHYKSFMNYGNPLQVEMNKAIAEDKRITREKMAKEANGDVTKRGTKRWALSTDGICEADGCDRPIKARKYCETHYARVRRLRSTELPKKRGGVLNKDIDKCLVIGCDNIHYQSGFCSTHVKVNREFGTPYRPKIIRYCGIEGCERVHLARGLCGTHYQQWMKVQEEHGLEWL